MRKTMFNYGKTFLSVICIFILTCCEKKHNDEKVNILKNAIENNLGKKLSIPIDLQLYTPFSKYTTDSTQIAQADLKIYTQINASCPSCIEGIDKWLKFTTKLAKYKVPVILVCGSKDNFELMKYLCENGSIKKFPFPFFLDRKNEYITKNSFMKTSNQLETVLTDSKNNILLIGNPIHSEEVERLYLKEIDKLARELTKQQKNI